MAASCSGRRVMNRFVCASQKSRTRVHGRGWKSLQPSFARSKSSGGVVADPCPVTGSRGSEADESAAPSVKLFDVPKLPFLGSMIPQYSKTQKFELTKSYEMWYEHRKSFGDFYSIGFPWIGKGIMGTTYVMSDPNEFMKVMRKEGQHPYGAIMSEWPFVRYYEDGGSSPGHSAGLALFTQGESWQRIRRFMQTDLLHPAAAKGYVPGMIKACQIASQGAPSHAKNFNEYTTFCSFDMFSSIVFGEFTGLASGSDDQEENSKFCRSSMAAMETIVPMMASPAEMMQNRFLGMKTEMYSTFEDNFKVARKVALQKLENFKERKETDKLVSDFEKQSYASLAIDRYLSSLGEEGALKEEDVGEIIMVALIAALDTTSSLLNWCIIHLALNPDVQEKLHAEISSHAAANGGVLTEDYLSKSNSVYLNAVLRENHRISPPIALNLTKENITDEVEIHGKTIPKQSMCILDTRSVGMDPDIVPSPDKFDPTRWIGDDQAKSRKGTPAEVLDHPLYREPFSAGARKCPGSRVAYYEAKILLSQLVLDWNISFAEEGKVKSWRDVPYFNGLTVQPTVPELSFERRQ